jgi:hypothetical protein
MPDLTIEIMQECTRRQGETVRVTGSRGAVYEVTFWEGGASCTCPAYRFSRYTTHPFGKSCKHLAEAARQTCGWHELYGQPIEVDGTCPQCGAPTRYVRVAV